MCFSKKLRVSNLKCGGKQFWHIDEGTVMVDIFLNRQFLTSKFMNINGM